MHELFTKSYLTNFETQYMNHGYLCDESTVSRSCRASTVALSSHDRDNSLWASKLCWPSLLLDHHFPRNSQVMGPLTRAFQYWLQTHCSVRQSTSICTIRNNDKFNSTLSFTQILSCRCIIGIKSITNQKRWILLTSTHSKTFWKTSLKKKHTWHDWTKKTWYRYSNYWHIRDLETMSTHSCILLLMFSGKIISLWFNNADS